MRRALGVAAALVAALLVPASASPVPDGAEWTEEYFPSADGTVLHADVLRPQGHHGRVPVVVAAGPYFGHSTPAALTAPNPLAVGPEARFYDLVKDGHLLDRGYALVLVDTRGYGASGGCTDVGGPLEQSDVKAAVEWAATRPWSTGKVAMWGKSYDAWTELMGLAERPRGLAAVVIQSPLDSGYKAAYEHGVHYDSEWLTMGQGYQEMSVSPPTVDDGQQAHTNNATGAADPVCYADVAVGQAGSDPSSEYWRQRDLVARAGASRVPVLWSHGFNDEQCKPTNLLATWQRLRGPKRAWLGQWAHVRGSEVGEVGRDGFMTEAMAWLDHYLKGKRLPSYPPVRVQDSEGDWRAEAAWPPADAVVRRMPLRAGTYLDAPGNAAASPRGGSWTVSQPAPRTVRIAGEPRLRVSATSTSPLGATLVATVYDLPPEGRATMLTRGAYALPASGTTSVPLWPEDWVLARGHRVAVYLAGDDSSMYQPVWTGGAVTVTGGRLELPVLAHGRRLSAVGGQAAAAQLRPRATIDRTELAGRESHADFG